jgi:hypothetical protein
VIVACAYNLKEMSRVYKHVYLHIYIYCYRFFIKSVAVFFATYTPKEFDRSLQNKDNNEQTNYGSSLLPLPCTAQLRLNPCLSYKEINAFTKLMTGKGKGDSHQIFLRSKTEYKVIVMWWVNQSNIWSHCFVIFLGFRILVYIILISRTLPN